MKKFVWLFAIFCWMVYGIYCLRAYFNDQPSEQAQKIINSLNSGKDWNFYDTYGGKHVVHSSGVSIYPSLFAIIKHKHEVRNQYFSWNDLYQINTAAKNLIALLEEEEREKKKENAKEAMSENLKSLNDAINKME